MSIFYMRRQLVHTAIFTMRRSKHKKYTNIETPQVEHVYLGLVICVSTWSLYVSTYLKYETNKCVSVFLYPVFEDFHLNNVTLRGIKREFVFILDLMNETWNACILKQ